MRYVGGHGRARRRRAADRGRHGDERASLQRGLDRPAVRDERDEPDPQDREHDRGAARLAGRRLRRTLPELERRLELVGLAEDVLERYPIELSGGMKQRMVMVLSTLLDPSLLIADEVTSALDVSTPEGRRGDARRVPRPGVREEHDRDHPRHLDPLPDRRHDHGHVRGQARREGAGRRRSSRRPGIRTRSCCSLAARGRRALSRSGGWRHPGPAAVAARPADRLPLPGPLPARVREVRRGAAVRRGRAGPLGRLLEGGRRCSSSTGSRRSTKSGTFGGERADRRPRRQLRRASPARSSRSSARAAAARRRSAR